MELFKRFQFVHQVMADAAHFFGHDLGGTNVHVLIDLHGIRRYNLSIHRLRQCNGKLCLADRSWAGQYD